MELLVFIPRPSTKWALWTWMLIKATTQVRTPTLQSISYCRSEEPWYIIKSPCRILETLANTNNSKRQAGGLKPERAVTRNSQEGGGCTAMSSHSASSKALPRLLGQLVLKPWARQGGSGWARRGGWDMVELRAGTVSTLCLCPHQIQPPLAGPTFVTMASRGWGARSPWNRCAALNASLLLPGSPPSSCKGAGNNNPCHDGAQFRLYFKHHHYCLVLPHKPAQLFIPQPWSQEHCSMAIKTAEVSKGFVTLFYLKWHGTDGNMFCYWRWAEDNVVCMELDMHSGSSACS